MVAVIRVVLWHTWSWAWLSWVPAMPAMFFATGSLLRRSIEGHGWWTTLHRRATRLLIPYWCYAATCIVAMVASGWRPGVTDLLPWLVPLTDPVGSATMPGLWIPLWYVRAYIWFVLAGGILTWVARRLGAGSVAVAAVVGVGVWYWAERGNVVSLAVGDAAAYAPFVLAGMVYRPGGGSVPRRLTVAAALAAGATALLVWQRLGPDDGIVNRSYLLTMLVGAAGLLLVAAFRGPLTGQADRWKGPIDRLNRRALTIYLWQGFGLVAAQHLVDDRVTSLPVRAVLSLAVVVTIVVAAVVVVGPVEDLAARRRRAAPGPRRPARRVSHAIVPIGLALAVLGVVAAPDTSAGVQAPMSGVGVVARAGLIEDALSSQDEMSAADRTALRAALGEQSVPEVLLTWVDGNRDALDAIGTTRVDLAVTAPDGSTERLRLAIDGDDVTVTRYGGDDAPIPWWSMTKVLTSAWLMELVQDGTVRLDDPVSRWIPDVPSAAEMTLEQLARHTAGVPIDEEVDLVEADPRADIDAFVERGELRKPPGVSFAYSRTGYFVLALALERASGTTWSEAMESFAARAGVPISFDEDDYPADHVTDPDGHGYRGRLWSSGGVALKPAAGSRLVHWIFTEGLDPSSVASMSRFAPTSAYRYYGIGLTPLCPCERVDEWLRAERFGLDSASGSFAVDGSSGSAIVVHADRWWDDEGPAKPFYDLESVVLDRLALS